MEQLFEYSDVLKTPVEAGYFSYPECQLPFPSHWHYFIEMIYVFSGKVVVTCKDEKFELSAGDFIFIPPEVIHSFSSVSGNEYKFGVIKYDINKIHLSSVYLPKLGVLLRDSTLQKELPIAFHEDQFKDIDLKKMFDDSIRECTEKKYGYDSYLYACFVQVIIKLIRIWQDGGYLNNIVVNTKTDNYSIRNIIEYIDEHSGDNIPVSELAKMCNMSYSYFAKEFKAMYGQSCKEYIEFIKLSKAENLLLFTNSDLNFISEETGFADCSHFIRVFKRRYGMTPKKYRSVAQGGQ